MFDEFVGHPGRAHGPTGSPRPPPWPFGWLRLRGRRANIASMAACGEAVDSSPVDWPFYLLTALAAGVVILGIDRSSRRRRGLPPEETAWEMQDVHSALAEGRKIEAIRRYRKITGAGLREAKLAVDAIEDGRPPPQREDTPLPSPDDTVRRFAAAGQKIEAIKRYREQTGTGLRDAKDVVESLPRPE